jgi:hypothetical protein
VELISSARGVGGLAARRKGDLEAMVYNYARRGSAERRVRLDVRGWPGTSRWRITLLSKQHPVGPDGRLAPPVIDERIAARRRKPIEFVMPADSLAWVRLQRS